VILEGSRGQGSKDSSEKQKNKKKGTQILLAGDLGFIERLAPQTRSAAARRNPRPLGRGQGELYKNVPLPFREAPPFRAGRLHKGELGTLNKDIAGIERVLTALIKSLENKPLNP